MGTEEVHIHISVAVVIHEKVSERENTFFPKFVRSYPISADLN